MKVGGIYKDTAAILYECVYVEKDQVVLKTKHDDKLFVVFPNFYSTFEEVKPIHKRWLILRDKGNISIVCDSLEELKGHIHRLDESEILSVVELHVQEGIFDIALDEI